MDGQEAPSIFDEQVSDLSFVYSKGVPHYLEQVNHTDMYFRNGSDTTPFVFDAMNARFDNYTDMLKVAGFI